MTEWKPGDLCRVVEHDPVTRRPAVDAAEIPAVVQSAFSPVVEVRAEGFSGPLTFYADSGWHLKDNYRWRLLPGTEAAG